MPIQTLQARAANLRLDADELVPRLHAAAVAGSMAEQADPDRGTYITDLDRESAERARSFASSAIDFAADLRESVRQDISLAEVWKMASIDPAASSALLRFGERDLIDLAASVIEAGARYLLELELTNPGQWKRWIGHAVVIGGLATLAVGAATAAVFLTGGAAAIATAPWILGNIGCTMVTAAASVVEHIVPS
jgi:hypothetical protein